MFRSILLPLDGSPFAEHAVPLAAAIARHSHASICLLQVMPPLADRYFWAPLPGSDLEHDLHANYRKQSLAYLESIGQKLNGIPYRCELLDEHIDITEAIMTESAKVNADLIVMSSHGRGPFHRLWLGSIADHVYRSSPVPVLLARPQQEEVDWQSDWKIQRVLVALDGSADAEEILDAALNFGSSFHAELLFIEVLANAAQTQQPEPRPTTESAQDQSRVTNPRAYLESVTAYFRGRGLQASSSLVVSSDVAAAILEAAASADLIAMRTHARGSVSRMFSGSIVDQVVQSSHVPILITRPYSR